MYAFKLTEQIKKEGFSGGTVMCSPLGHTFDVKAALDAHDGIIPTDDPMLVALLRNYDALESTEVPEGAEPVAIPGRENQAATAEPPWLPQQGSLDPQVGSVGEVPAVHAEQDSGTSAAVEPSTHVAGVSAIPDSTATSGQAPPRRPADSPTEPDQSSGSN